MKQSKVQRLKKKKNEKEEKAVQVAVTIDNNVNYID